ncbi:unnamed protein product [Lampetra planeri]
MAMSSKVLASLVILLPILQVCIAEEISLRGPRLTEQRAAGLGSCASATADLCVHGDWGRKCPSGCRMQGLMTRTEKDIGKRIGDLTERLARLGRLYTQVHTDFRAVSDTSGQTLNEHNELEVRYSEVLRELERRIIHLQRRINMQLQQLTLLQHNIKTQVSQILRVELDIDVALRTCKGSCARYMEYRLDKEKNLQLEKAASYIANLKFDRFEEVVVEETLNRRVETSSHTFQPTPPITSASNVGPRSSVDKRALRHVELSLCCFSRTVRALSSIPFLPGSNTGTSEWDFNFHDESTTGNGPRDEAAASSSAHSPSTTSHHTATSTTSFSSGTSGKDVAPLGTGVTHNSGVRTGSAQGGGGYAAGGTGAQTGSGSTSAHSAHSASGGTSSLDMLPALPDFGTWDMPDHSDIFSRRRVSTSSTTSSSSGGGHAGAAASGGGGDGGSRFGSLFKTDFGPEFHEEFRSMLPGASRSSSSLSSSSRSTSSTSAAQTEEGFVRDTGADGAWNQPNMHWNSDFGTASDDEPDFQARSHRTNLSEYIGARPQISTHDLYHKHCLDVLQRRAGGKASGLYDVRPRGAKRLLTVYCEQDKDGGGWTLVQQRQDGSLNFNRSFSAYQEGFGTVDGSGHGELWLGLEAMYLLAHEDSTMRVELQGWDGAGAHAEYTVTLRDDSEGYALQISDYRGTAGNALVSGVADDPELTSHGGMTFSTFDRDTDKWSDGSCAEWYGGGWWYNACQAANLNGVYYQGGPYDPREKPPYEVENGVVWATYRGSDYSLKRTSVRFRRVQIPIVE